MKQLDVVVSPPAFVWDPNLTLTHVTFDLNPCDLWPLGQMSNKFQKVGDPTSNSSVVMNFFLVIFFLVNYYLGIVTDRQTDRRKAMHKSPPCISTGGLKNFKRTIGPKTKPKPPRENNF